uniref:Uncharacterized protein n=1 Tax=Amphimedon queenslandica TaxID=400682 RepID=A0A1X7U939_AMPQE
MSCQIKLLAAQANKQSTASNVICCLQIPNKLLYLWKLDSKTCPLMENLNNCLSSMHIPLQLQSFTLKSSFHQRLIVRCSDLYHRAARLSRRKRESLLQKKIIISVRHSDVVQLSSLQEEVREAVVSNDVMISHLVKQLDTFTKSKCFHNKGKAINEVEDQQRRRKIAKLRESCKLALWFADSFNINLLVIYFQVEDSNDTIQLQYKDSCVASSATNLPTTTNQILYLLDRFAVSDELYHELSMICPSLPRSHIIRKLRTSISNNVEIIRLPTSYFRAYRPVIPAIKSALQTYESFILIMHNICVCRLK